MGGSQPNWSFLTLWATIAAVLVAVGLGLPYFGHPIARKRVFFAGCRIPFGTKGCGFSGTAFSTAPPRIFD